MIWDILAWIGAIFAITSTLIVAAVSLMLLKELILEAYYDFKITNLKSQYDYKAKELAVSHLHELKKNYPDLEISYNDKEIK